MSRHEGVSCDVCLKGNFRGRRFKCLICYDYDLCASCYESGATTTRHTTEHPMQCILTRVDYDLFYGGDNFSVEQPQSFSCPYCGKMGYTETSLQEHVTSDHPETSTEVICPICAALPGGDPNHVTDDFTAHLTLEHRSSSVRHVRRMFHPGRGLGGPRARRTNMHFTSGSTGGLSSSTSSQSTVYAPSSREAMDPIAELLSQLSGVRRAAGGPISSSGPSASHNHSSTCHGSSYFLLSRLNEPKLCEAERQRLEAERADRSLFVQELLLSTLTHDDGSSSSSSSGSSLSSSRGREERRRGLAGGGRDFADFGAMGCVDIMPLDVALERLELRERGVAGGGGVGSASAGAEPPPRPL
ncbi:hypothetical protein NHX12_027966 [Muraenolepis orangiensis]|uniref:RING-type E3 ubiquitin transferase n=1 Tax=Muraenolepis orangiensis TaxID=630683 RepID=A0A9Q0IPR1_9TELE|nr:hypothetical protein NHX12_027966 [Muraenolepis orangiensis]